MTLDIWTIVGFTGGGIFILALIVQWIASERAGKSIVTKLFWWLRILGATILMLYAFHRQDIVFIVFQTGATIVSVFGAFRNLYLMRDKHTKFD